METPEVSERIHEFTEQEIEKIEYYYSIDLAECHIAALFDFTPEWFSVLLKRQRPLRKAKERGKALGSFRSKAMLWKKIQEGDSKLLEFYLKAKENYASTNKLEVTGANGGPQVIIAIPGNGREISQIEADEEETSDQ